MWQDRQGIGDSCKDNERADEIGEGSLATQLDGSESGTQDG